MLSAPSLVVALARPRDGAGLALVRAAFGLVMATAMLRFLAKGWVDLFYHRPDYHFAYHGFAWVAPLPGLAMEALVIATGLAAVLMALGAWTRRSAAAFTLGFTWIELCDVSTYLNHYYLVSVLGLLFVLVPAGADWSIDAWLRCRRGLPAVTVREGHYAALRIQLTIVYVMAALAKIQEDWLVEGLPLRLWLARHAEVPLIGPLLADTSAAIAASWIGLVYDLSIPWLLWWRRTRAIAYLPVVAFHVTTWLLFPIGMFPWIMIAGSLVFLAPEWPRRWLPGRHPPAVAKGLPRRGETVCAGLLAMILVLQVLLPLRCHLHPGDVRWHEQGFRFSWRVMVMEKTGALDYRLVDREDGSQRRVDPADLLMPHQVKQLETQPDLILQFARELAHRERRHGRDVAVYAESWASLNGRAPAPLVDPTVDLTTIVDTWDRSAWVLPGPP